MSRGLWLVLRPFWRPVTALLVILGFFAMHGGGPSHMTWLPTTAAGHEHSVLQAVDHACPESSCELAGVPHGMPHGSMTDCVPALLWLVLVILLGAATSGSATWRVRLEAAAAGVITFWPGRPRRGAPSLAQLCLLRV